MAKTIAYTENFEQIKISFMTTINHDQLFKELLTTFLVEFIDLFFSEVLEYLDTSSITFVDKEVFTDITQGNKKIYDIIALTKLRDQDYSFLVHIENQAYNQTDFNQRMYRYFCNLYLKYNIPIYPIVVFSYNSPLRPDKNDFIIDFPNYIVMKFNYKVVQLNRLNWKNFLQQKNPVAAALMAKMKIKNSDRPRVKAECLRLLVTLKLNPAKMQLISGFIDTYLNLNQQEEAIFQSQLSTIELEQQEQIMELTTSWQRKGRIEGQSHTILRQLNRKFGTLDDTIVSTIKSLESSQLDSLTEDLLDFQSLNDLQQWLENYSN